MEKTYKIFLTLEVESGATKKTIREAVYAYLEELIDDNSLDFEESE